MKKSIQTLRLYAAIWLLLIAFQGEAQQQPMYSQYMFNTLNINPAYAGSRGVVSTSALFRDQWAGMPGAPKTTVFSVDMPFNEKKIGVGLQVYDDRLGVERRNGFNASYAFRIQMNETGVLSLGVQAGVLNYRANFTDVNTFQQQDAVFNQNVNGLLPAAGAGVYYQTDQFYVGVSAPALLTSTINPYTNKADVSSAGKDLHLYLHSGFRMDLSEDLVLKPSLLIKAVSGAPLQADLNANLWIQDLIAIGASYRTGDAVVGMLEWQINDQLRLGYAYDKSFSNLGAYNGATHELMLRIEFGSEGKRMSSARYF